MPERKTQFYSAMKSPWFRETLCDLFNTVQRIESSIGEGVSSSKLETTEPAKGLVLNLESGKDQHHLIPAEAANEAVGFTSRSGIPLFIAA